MLAKTEISKWLDAKDEAIQWLKRRLVQQQDETKQHEAKVQELEEYIRVQEDYFAERVTEAETKTADIRDAHEKETKCVNLVNDDLTRICVKLEAK